MGATGLLTILAILISGYGLLPDEKRLDIRLRISWLDLLIVGVPVIAILIVIYSPVILSTGYVDGVDWVCGFTEDTLVFTCLLFIILFFGWKLMGSRMYGNNECKSVCMAECLSPGPISVSDFFKIFVPGERVKDVVLKEVLARQLPLDVTVNPHMFC